MTITRAQRTYPLALTASSLNTGIVAAYDWSPEDGSTALGYGKDHSGNAHDWTAPTTSPTVVTTSVGHGLDPSVGATLGANYYKVAGVGNLGLAVGTGDWSIWLRIRMPSVLHANNIQYELGRLTDSSGIQMTFGIYDVSSDGGFHWIVGSSSPILMNWSDNPARPANAISDLHITHIGGVTAFYVDGVLKKTVAAATWNPNFLATTGASASAMGPYSNSTNKQDNVLIDMLAWTRGLSSTEVQTHQANPYSYYANAAPADSITVTSPAAGATLPPTINISGSIAGGSTVTSVEASFNGAAYTTIATTFSGGNFTGSLTGQAAGTGTLTVRSKNGATVVATTTVTGLTVVTDSVSFTNPGTTPATQAVGYRIFQRNASNQANVRITGSYTGSPTSLQYQWNGGAWATLVATPSGGAFDVTVTLQGPAQGDLLVRFSNSTTISATLPAIGVGDVYVVMGQSNHVGKSTNYIPAVAPAGNPGWLSTIFDKAGRWRNNAETSGQPFDSVVSGDTATYPVEVDPSPAGSYFGKLATFIMSLGVPVAFVPCALGSTTVAAWAVNTATTSLYGAALARATVIGAYKAVLWWLGETDTTGTTNSAYQSGLNPIINDWCVTRFPGKKWILMNINATGNAVGTGGTGPTDTGFNAIHAAIASVAASNTNVAGLADMNGQFSNSIHYGTGSATEVINVATQAYNAISTAFYSSVTGVTVSPATATGSATFTAVVNGGNTPSQAVNWSTSAGSITSGGVFTAPAATGSVQTITITATSTQDPTKFGTATVTIAAASTVTGVTVSPATATGSATFSATVAGTNNPSQSVTWAAIAGSIGSNGAFVAPAATGSVQTITITATSTQDATKSGTAVVTIAALVPTVTGVAVSPATASGSATFTAVVSGANNPSQSVTWAASAGSITSGGTFTAPAPTGSVQTITVTATSTQDATKSGTATVTIAAAVPMPTLTVSITMGDESGAAANLSGLSVSFENKTAPHLTGEMLYQSGAATTNSAGVLSFSFQSSAIASGSSGLLSVLMSNGRHYLGLATAI